MRKLTIFCVVHLVSALSVAGTINVNWNGSGDYTTIQAGVNAAGGGDTVVVAAGTYVENVVLTGANIVLTSSDPDDPDVVANTIIDAGGSGRGVTFAGTEGPSFLLAGFTITGGYLTGVGNHGGGIRGYKATATVSKCVITGNSIEKVGSAIHGFDGVISKCRLEGNFSNTSGGAVAGSLARISNCVISGNYGGALWNCDGDIVNCTIANNTVNDSTAAYGAFRRCDGKFVNCIIRGNDAPEIHSENTAVLSYSCFAGASGNGNIDADPLFVDADANDFHLLAGSPCIDGGTNSPPGGLPLTDIEGGSRPIDGDNDGLMVADMGAYETPAGPDPVIGLSAWSFNFAALQDGVNPAEQTLTIRNTGSGVLQWEIVEDCPWLWVSPGTGISGVEPNEVSLIVDITGLTGGDYNCQVNVVDPAAINSPQVVTVSLSITGPIIELSGSSFEFWDLQDGANPDDQVLTITNIGGGILDWELRGASPWLSVDPNSGSSSGQPNDVTLSVDTNGLADDSLYSCTLIISDPDAENNPQTVEVSLGIAPYGGVLWVPYEYPTIQAAIDAADTNDIVVVADGTYTGEGNYDIDFKGKAITVRSEHGPENCIIDVKLGRRGFYFHSNEDPNTSILDGFTIIGEADNWWWSMDTDLPEGCVGGGICIVDSSATIRNCIISDNFCGCDDYSSTGGRGGGIYVRNSTARIIDCVISGNISTTNWKAGQDGRGGGIYLEDSWVTIANCLILQRDIGFLSLMNRNISTKNAVFHCENSYIAL